MKRWFKRWFGGGHEGNGSTSSPDMISCEEALARVYEYLDDELAPTDRGRVADHFAVCQRCYPHLRFEESFLRALRRVENGQGASPELKNRVLDALYQEGLERP